ncbi:HNH endonuclease signature motif containing protein [Gordonia sp. SL306]|uniref:HNH endonuclease signature motif containing protein n=1 Tax=Gordonia sp. SL306 TaxID=2995145 RepID=UPI00226FAF31|nr:HNH endonuclease signature motif containing protein [Gordonia sp. SL306]WAC57030.1 HNH endonuclease signature motif containing protein [Gordonia sp. SL306]
MLLVSCRSCPSRCPRGSHESPAVFTFSDAFADDAAAGDAIVSSLRAEQVADAARDLVRLSRQAEARAVLLAFRIGQAAHDEVLFALSAERQMMVRNQADKAAVGEISLQLGMSRIKAGTWYKLGDALQRRPKIRLAYLAGDVSTHRMSVMVHALESAPVPSPAVEPDAEASDTETSIDDSQVDDLDSDGVADDECGDPCDASVEDAPLDLEDRALELSSHPSTDAVLRDELEALVISLDPAAAAEARDAFAETWQNLTITNDSSGHANIDACVPAEHGVALREQIAALIAARVCRNDRRTIGRQRVAAFAELAGLGARLECTCGGDGCRAGNSDSQAAGDAAVIRPDSRDESDDGNAEFTDAEPQSELVLPELTVVLDPLGIEVPRLRGYGAIDPVLAADLSSRARVVSLPEAPRDRSAGLLVRDRGPAPPVDRTGHGGFDLPPPGALIYTPSTRIRGEILLSDHYCRYPYCGMPADQCEIDHLVAFDHRAPHVGGWTVPENLAPMCRPDHQRKHQGLWLPTMHTDRTITWRNPRTGQEIITYPR